MKLFARKQVVKLLCIFVWLSSAAHSRKIKQTRWPQVHRRLSENVTYQSSKYYDPQTTNMREFVEQQKAKYYQYNPEIKVKTQSNPDGRVTTGNADLEFEYEKILPPFNPPYLNPKLRAKVIEHQQSIEVFFKVFNLNLFSEDPQEFVGEYNNYFSIVNKRGMLFYYLSRFILYAGILYLFIQFLGGSYSKKTEGYEPDPSINTKFKIVVAAQSSSLSALLLVSVTLLLLSTTPRSQMNDVTNNLLFKFREIKQNVLEIIQMIKDLNARRISIAPDFKEKFVIQDQLTKALPNIQQDVKLAESFAESFRGDDQLTSYSTPLSLIFISVLLSGVSGVALYHKSSNLQVVLFICASLSLSYVVFSLGSFFAGFSTIFDICSSVLQFDTKDTWPSSGGGLIRFLGCSEQKTLFQQYYSNIVAQNAALKLYNNEMFRAGLPEVKDQISASRMTTFLTRLDASNLNINRISSIIDTNNNILEHMEQINNCNGVREWMFEAESKLCYTISSRLHLIFWIYWIAVITLVLVILTTHFGQQVMSKIEVKEQVNKHTFNRQRFANDFKLE